MFAAAGIYIMEMSRGRAMETLDEAKVCARARQFRTKHTCISHTMHARPPHPGCARVRSVTPHQARIGWQIYKYHLFNFRFSPSFADANTIELEARSARQYECVMEIQLYAGLCVCARNGCWWYAMLVPNHFNRVEYACANGITAWETQTQRSESKTMLLWATSKATKRFSFLPCFAISRHITLAPHFTEAWI